MKNNTLFFLILGSVALVVAGYFLWGQLSVLEVEPVDTNDEFVTDSPGTRSVELFYYDPTRDEDETGNIMCSRDGLVPVTRSIASMTPIEDTLKLLLLGDLTPAERAEGITTEYPLDGVSISSVALRADGTLRIEFNDPQNKLVGGSCRTAILAGQVIETAIQFPEVTSVDFLPDDVFQP